MATFFVSERNVFRVICVWYHSGTHLYICMDNVPTYLNEKVLLCLCNGNADTPKSYMNKNWIKPKTSECVLYSLLTELGGLYI